MKDREPTAVMNPGDKDWNPEFGTWTKWETPKPGDPDAGYVQVTSVSKPPSAEVEIHDIRARTAEDAATCCRCDGPIELGEQCHTVTRSKDGVVTYRQATHLRHLRA